MTENTTVKKPNLLDLAEVINDADQWTLEHTDTETGEITATDDEIKLYFGAEEAAEQKIIGLHNLKQRRVRNIANIDREVEEVKEELEAVLKPYQDRFAVLHKLKEEQENQIDRYKRYVHMFLEITGLSKFNFGVTKGHTKTNKSVYIPDDFDVATLPEKYRKTTIAPIKKELKAGIEADDGTVPDAITLKETQSFVWS